MKNTQDAIKQNFHNAIMQIDPFELLEASIPVSSEERPNDNPVTLTIKELSNRVISRLKSIILSGKSASCGFSGGKDSTAVVILMLESLRQLVEEGHDHLPKCYILNSNTRRENPLIDSYAEHTLSMISVFSAKHSLPVSVHQVQPSLTGRFTYYCLGRGKLPRFAGQTSDCAVNEKITPQQKLVKQLERENTHEIITLLGTRFEESESRRRSMQKYSMDELSIVEIEGKRTYSPIADWFVDDVWELISACSSIDGQPPKLYSTFLPEFSEMIRLYRDANDGVCGVVVGDSGNRSSCGSRFGCSYCTKTGKQDKSLESLLESDQSYGFMEPFVRFRQYLLSIRFDMSKRDWRGKRVNYGFMKIVPDYFSPETKRELLRFLITMDAMEKERARKHEIKYYAGDIEKNELNHQLCWPMFENVTVDDVLAIDFVWALQRDFEEASPAASDYLAIHELGKRYHIPILPESPRITIPQARWFDVSGSLPNREEAQGLLPHGMSIEDLPIEFTNEMEVQPGAGFSYLNAAREHYYELKRVEISEVCRAALSNDWIRIRRADLLRYDCIARRHDYIDKLFRQTRPKKEDEWGDLRLMTVHEYLIENSITQAEYREAIKVIQHNELKDKYAEDLFGVESVVEAIAETQDNIKQSRVLNKQITDINSYELAASQIKMF